MRNGLTLSLAVLLFGFMSVSAQPEPTPTPFVGEAALMTQAALEADIDATTAAMTAVPVVTAVFTDEPAPEATEEAPIVSVDVNITNPPAPEPEPEPVDYTGTIVGVGGILVAIAAIGWAWYQHRDTKRTLKETNQRVATDTRLQADIKSVFDQQSPATQQGVLRIMQLAALLTSWIPGTDDNQLVANMDAIVRGLPVTPVVTEPVVAQSLGTATTPQTTVTFTGASLSQADIERIALETYRRYIEQGAQPSQPIPQAPSAADAERIARERQLTGANAVAEGYDANSEAAG